MTSINAESVREQVDRLPRTSGVYLFRAANGKVLYVGKAKDLRSRVRSYFGAASDRSMKLVHIAKHTAAIDSFPVESDTEALLLEWNLIKEFNPPYNILLRDDKSYPYVKVTVREAFPRVFVTRRVRDDGSRYVGPFTDVRAMRRTLRTIKGMYTVRSCHYRMPQELPPRPCLDFHIGRCKAPCAGLQSEEEYNAMIAEILEILSGRTTRLRRDTQVEMNAAAERLEYEKAAELRDVLRGLDALQRRQSAIDPRGKNRDIVGFARDDTAVCGVVLGVREGRLVQRRVHYLANVEGESDEDLLGALVNGFYVRQAEDVPAELLLGTSIPDQDIVEEYLASVRDAPFRVRVPVRGSGLDLVRMASRNARHILERDRTESLSGLEGAGGPQEGEPVAGMRLKDVLELSTVVRTIACFDVSTLAGSESVGSCVWLRDGKQDPDEYRRFRIRETEDKKPDDYAMMQEIVTRYFDRRVREGRDLPDLVVVDGGKGQLGAAKQAMESAGVSDLPTVALAKREEEIFRAGIAEPLRLDRRDVGLQWLQRARDEAHRFALQYNRTLRTRRTLRSHLGTVPGVGPIREQALLSRFGSLDAIRKLNSWQLTQTPGIGEITARTIVEHLAASQ